MAFQTKLVCASGCPSKPGWNWPVSRLVTKAARTSAIKPPSRCASRIRIKSRTAAMVQNRVRCARRPMISPKASEIASGACTLPRPVAHPRMRPEMLSARPSSCAPLQLGAAMRMPSKATMIAGSRYPTAIGAGRLRPRSNPRRKSTVPKAMPPIRPAMPAMAFQSPPAKRR